MRLDHLSVLNRGPADEVKAYSEAFLAQLETPPVVIENRIGLVMLPATDTVQGTRFHLGEVLVAQSRVQLGSSEGYTVLLGRDLEHSLAVAILDAALAEGVYADAIWAFVEKLAQAQAEDDAALLRRVEATRVALETF